MEIKEALAALDPERDEHWTADGLPLVEAVRELIKDRPVDRAAITAADPELTRELAAKRAVAESDGPETAEPPATPPDPSSAINLSDFVDDEPEPPTKAEQIAARMAELDARHAELQVEVDALKQKQWLIDRERAALYNMRARENDGAENMRGIQRVIKAGQRARMAKVQRAQELAAVGITPDQLRPAAPIDEALRVRKPARGSTRPGSQG